MQTAAEAELLIQGPSGPLYSHADLPASLALEYSLLGHLLVVNVLGSVLRLDVAES